MRHPWLQCQIPDLFIDESGNKLNYSIFNYSSNRSWKFKSYGKTGFQKTLNEVREKGIVIKQLTTDRHMQIRKYLKEDEPQIDHQFDVWHFLKNTESKVIAAAKKFSCTALQKWIKSIVNHWWTCSTSGGSEQLLREKWVSVFFQVQNKHAWMTGDLFRKYEHPELIKKQINQKNGFCQTQMLSWFCKILLYQKLY